MAWEKEPSKAPAAIGGLEVTMATRPGSDFYEEITIAALDQWEDLGYMPEAGKFEAAQVGTALVLTEGVDFEVDYVGGQIRALTGGALAASDIVSVNYKHVLQQVRYSLVVLDQDGEVLNRHRDLNLVPHLTAGEKTQLQAFMDTLRARAEAQLL